MAKEELMQFEGLVIEAMPNASFRMQLHIGQEIVAYTARAGCERVTEEVSLRLGEETTDLLAQA
jgi:hypothetical protein